MKLATRLAWKASRSPRLAHLLFGVSFPTPGPEDHFFDLTTPILARKALESIRADTRVLDLGTGPAAVLGLTFWKRTGCTVVSCDVNPDIVGLASANVARNGAPIQVVRSDFFDAIHEAFDVVTFNAPYVPSARGAALGLPESRRSVWDGGVEATDVVAAFLRRLGVLESPVKAYLGVNALHAPRDSVLALIRQQPTLELREAYRPPLIPVDVYVLENRSPRDAVAPLGKP